MSDHAGGRPQPSYDPLYIRFLYHFNVDRDYFECHEVMEELWLEEGRDPLWQGLLQVAVALYHHRNGNVSGAVKLFTGALEKLEPRREADIGIDMRDLLARSRAYLDALLKDREQMPFRPFDMVITDPKLSAAVAELVAGDPVGKDG